MTVFCSLFPVFRHIYFAGMVFFTAKEISLTFFPMPHWTGTARGYMFSTVYLFATPLLLNMIFSPKYKTRLFPPGSFFYFLYFLSILLSGINAVHKQQWAFEVWKMFWMYITFLAAFNYLNNTKDLSFFVYVVCIILIYVFLVALNQKYRMGKIQVASTFPHQNSLSLYLELFGLLLLGVLMNEQISKLLFVLTVFAFGGSALLIIFTYSRGGLVIYYGGIAIVCALSFLINGFSLKRLILMLFGLIILLSIIGHALPHIIQRFTSAPEASKNTRIQLAVAARSIANDYSPFGVGANNFSEYSGRGYDYTFERYENTKGDKQTGGIVETIYMLVAAECGWYALVLLLLWFLYYYFSDIISIFYLRKKPCSGFVIGLFGGLTCIYWHSSLEWSLKQSNNFAEQMIVYALIGVIAVHRKSIRAAYKRKRSLESTNAILSQKQSRRSLPPSSDSVVSKNRQHSPA